MKNIVLATLVLGVSLFGLQAHASANLLSDSGFDTQAVGELNWGSTPWWGGSGGSTAVGIEATQARSPSHSARFFTWGGGDSWTVLAQTLNSGIVSGGDYTVSAYFMRTADITASANIKVEWLNGSGATIATSVSTPTFDNTYSANSWNLLSDHFTAAPGAVGAKYEMVYSKTGSGSGDILVDDTNFDSSVVPEPTSLLLLGSGLIGLLGMTRKK